MKLKVIFTKEELEILEPFFKEINQNVDVAYPIGENFMCELETTGDSAHVLFHAGIEYHIKKLKQSITQ